MRGWFGRWGGTVAVAVALAGAAAPLTVADHSETIPGPVPARVVTVVDGDTLVVRARIWLGQDLQTLVRLGGADAPELRGACARERRLAERARRFVVAKVGNGDVVLHDIRYGKYASRVVALVVAADGEDLASALIGAGLGRPYEGGRRASWCAGNRIRSATP